MIQQLRIVGEHFTVSKNIKHYVETKIGKLDKYLPRRARRVAHAEVMLRQEKARATGDATVEILLHVPDDVLKARASADDMTTAVDLAENKLKQQIETYRNEHSPRFYRHLLHRLRRRSALA